MKCLDSTFCIDLANGAPAAVLKAAELSKTGERLAIAAPALTEFLVGAFHQGGKRLEQALAYISELEVLDITEPISVDAARLGGECSRRGEAVGTLDLLIASAAKHHHAPLLSRDSDFGRIPGLTLETY
ncbi:MAG: type II toxin-antitoxin system VapC family toxin [Thermoplasmata archaeon]|nr:type II toxin-antitoxin system VapC family toxin [Thermoplasmata archaeon]